MPKQYLNNLAALTSGNLTELSSALPERDELRNELLKLSERIDERFGLVTVRCPIEPA